MQSSSSLDVRLRSWHFGLISFSVLIILATASGCGHGSGSSAQGLGMKKLSAGGTQPSAAYQGPVSRTRVYKSVGVTIGAPPSSARPAVSWQNAYRMCQTTAACVATSGPAVELASFSDATYGGDSNSARRQSPYSHVLAWVLTWHNSNCTVLGPASVQADPKFDDACDTVSVVDANSGAFLEGFVSAPPN
jgi:hypothetical protein